MGRGYRQIATGTKGAGGGEVEGVIRTMRSRHAPLCRLDRMNGFKRHKQKRRGMLFDCQRCTERVVECMHCNESFCQGCGLNDRVCKNPWKESG